MNEIKLFNNIQFGSIRVFAGEDGNALFCLADVCKALDLKLPSRVKSRLYEGGFIL